MKNLHTINQTILNNGVKLVHVYIPNFPVAVSSFWSKVGSRNDPKGKEGLAHFFEHLLLTRTNKFPDRQKRLIEIEGRGFLFNAFTSLETSQYYYIHSNEMINDALDFLIEGFSSSIFNETDIEQEKSIIIDEERRNRNDPEAYIWRLANSALWPDSQLGSNFYGDKKSLDNINLLDLDNFYSNYYQPKNSTFVLINSINNLDEQISKIDSLNKIGTSLKFSPDKFNNKKDIVFEQRDIDYSLLSLSFITCSGLNYKDCLVLNFIKRYMAGGWMSRLVSRLRVESKLTYWVDGRSENLSDTGYLRFTNSVNNEKIPEVLKIFENEIIDLKNEKIENKVFDKHKNSFKSEIMRNCLNTGYLNWWYGFDLTAFGKPLPSIEQYIKDIENISVEEVMLIAQKYLKAENFSLAIIGKKNITDRIPNFQ
jgi:predicted Zn-dependent peptidase